MTTIRKLFVALFVSTFAFSSFADSTNNKEFGDIRFDEELWTVETPPFFKNDPFLIKFTTNLYYDVMALSNAFYTSTNVPIHLINSNTVDISWLKKRIALVLTNHNNDITFVYNALSNKLNKITGSIANMTTNVVDSNYAIVSDNDGYLWIANDLTATNRAYGDWEFGPYIYLKIYKVEDGEMADISDENLTEGKYRILDTVDDFISGIKRIDSNGNIIQSETVTVSPSNTSYSVYLSPRNNLNNNTYPVIFATLNSDDSSYASEHAGLRVKTNIPDYQNADDNEIATVKTVKDATSSINQEEYVSLVYDNTNIKGRKVFVTAPETTASLSATVSNNQFSTTKWVLSNFVNSKYAQSIGGVKTFTGLVKFTYGGIEVWGPTTSNVNAGYVDFHLPGSTTDYDLRLYGYAFDGLAYLHTTRHPPARDSSLKLATTKFVRDEIAAYTPNIRIDTNQVCSTMITQTGAISIDCSKKIYKYSTASNLSISSITASADSLAKYPIASNVYSIEIWVTNTGSSAITIALPAGTVWLTDYKTVAAGKTAVICVRYSNSNKIVASYAYNF